MAAPSEPAVPKRSSDPQALAPVTQMLSSRLLVLANLLKRGAILRYRRTADLSSVEFGLVASLGRRPPVSVNQLADAVGRDKAQTSRALSTLVQRKLIARQVNPDDNREVLVALTPAGLAVHDTLLAGATERTETLLDAFSDAEIALLEGFIDRLSGKAAAMLRDEQSAG